MFTCIFYRPVRKGCIVCIASVPSRKYCTLILTVQALLQRSGREIYRAARRLQILYAQAMARDGERAGTDTPSEPRNDGPSSTPPDEPAVASSSSGALPPVVAPPPIECDTPSPLALRRRVTSSVSASRRATAASSSSPGSSSSDTPAGRSKAPAAAAGVRRIASAAMLLLCVALSCFCFHWASVGRDGENLASSARAMLRNRLCDHHSARPSRALGPSSSSPPLDSAPDVASLKSAMAVDGALVMSSDERLKRIIDDCTLGLQEVTKLRPRLFTYRPGNARGLSTTRVHAGFIAQEVRDAGIDLAVDVGDDGYLNLAALPIIAALVNAVQEVSNRLSHLSGLSARLISELSARVQQQEAAMAKQDEQITRLSSELEKRVTPTQDDAAAVEALRAQTEQLARLVAELSTKVEEERAASKELREAMAAQDSRIARLGQAALIRAPARRLVQADDAQSAAPAER